MPRGNRDPQKGQFQLRWYQGSRAVYKGVGHDVQEAITARDNQIANLEAERAANAAGRALVPDAPGRVVLAEAKQRFLVKKRLVRRDEGDATTLAKKAHHILAKVNCDSPDLTFHAMLSDEVATVRWLQASTSALLSTRPQSPRRQEWPARMECAALLFPELTVQSPCSCQR
jgi:hypothetical protein